MERIDKLLALTEYRDLLKEIETAEKDRIYCGHDLRHFLDVARLMQIRALEQKVDLKQDLIYAIALMHDIGRGEQYRSGMHHDLAGMELCERLLPACGYEPSEIGLIKDAIGGHSQSLGNEGEASKAGELLKWADHLSRNCFCCSAADTCHWPEERKNKTITQ